MAIDYGFTCKLQAATFDEAVTRVTDALQKEGFGVVTEIDVQSTLKKKLNLDYRPYRILGACNPNVAHKAIEGEPWIGLLLPCNVVVQQCGEGEIEVGFLDPGTIVGCSGNKGMEPIATDTRMRLRRVMHSLE